METINKVAYMMEDDISRNYKPFESDYSQKPSYALWVDMDS